MKARESPAGADHPLQPAGYRPRIAEGLLDDALEAVPMVLVEGAKGCGKTWLALSRARTKMMLAEDPDALWAAQTLPHESLSSGPRPLLVDEWQRAPHVWDTARGLSDVDHGTGKFLFTGSYARADAVTRHSGAGRLMRVQLRPMSLLETGDSTGEVSLSALMDGQSCSALGERPSAVRLAELICRGGWPRHPHLSTAACQRLLVAYLDETARVDLNVETGSAHNPVKVGRLLRALARNVADVASQALLGRETGADGAKLNHQTVSRYLDALTRLFVLEDLAAWSPHMRSASPARQSPKRHMVDPSLAVAALGVGPERLAGDPRALGSMFESLAVRDLRVYGDAIDMSVFHHRDGDGGEIDAVIEARDGRWMAVEVKLGANPAMIDASAHRLRTVVQRIDTSQRGDLVRLAILTAFGTVAHDRSDGVSVVPISLLGP